MRSANGGHAGLPAEFLIDRDGTVIHAKYGKHAGDQWSVDELLEYAKVALAERREGHDRVPPNE